MGASRNLIGLNVAQLLIISASRSKLVLIVSRVATCSMAAKHHSQSNDQDAPALKATIFILPPNQTPDRAQPENAREKS
jgi:hypothetical protein